MNIYDSRIAILELIELPFDLKMLLGEAKILYYQDSDAENCEILLNKIENECLKREIKLRITPLSLNKIA